MALLAARPTLAQAPPEPAAENATPNDEPAAPAASEPLSPTALTDSNPAVRAALEHPREEPRDYFQAVSWLIEFGRPDLAKPILEELAALELTDAQRAALVTEFGSHSLLQLAQTPALAPTGRQFAEACMAAAAAANQAPERIAALVAQLADPSREVRHAARVDLAATGQPGATAALEALARENNPQRRAAIVSAIVPMDPLVRDPLLAMLETRDSALRGVVADLLRHLQVPQAVPLLATNDRSAAKSLIEALRRYCQGTPPFPIDAQNEVELWRWDDRAKRLSSQRYAVDEARTIWMARLARELARLRPDNRSHERYALVLNLEAAGLTGTQAVTVQATDTALLNDVLADALKAKLPFAAIAIIDELGKRKDVGMLYSAGAAMSPLADALVNGNRRVRFAALRAITAIDPQSPYPGSSRVPDALAYFAGSTGERRGVVASPTAARASDLAGQLAAHGLDADGFNNGREAVLVALETSDLELVLVDMDILLPEVRQVVYELRIHPTTAEVPIALLTADGRLEAAQQIASEHQRVIAVSRPHTPEALARIVDRLQTLAGRDAVTADQRAAEAVESTAWIAKLLADNRSFYALYRAEPVIEAAAYQPSSNQSAIASLVEFGTPASQRALVNFASQTTLPTASRAAAVAGFRQSVDAHGVLLTSDEIIAQYNRYNASSAADADTQKVFGAILDAIEAPRAANPPPPPWKIPPP